MYRPERDGAIVPDVRSLPAAFLAALRDREEVLVTSREPGQQGTVPTWFLVEPGGSLYLFTLAFSRKAQRWRTDPWVRLTVPGTPISAEGHVQFVTPAELGDEAAARIVERWAMQGAPTVEGLRRGLRDGLYALVRVTGLPASSSDA